MAEHSPGPWTLHEDGECILDANGQHIICFGHDYDDYGGFSATLPQQKDRQQKEIAVIEANIELVTMAPQMLADILTLRALIHRASYHDLPMGTEEVMNDTEHYERFRPAQ